MKSIVRYLPVKTEPMENSGITVYIANTIVWYKGEELNAVMAGEEFKRVAEVRITEETSKEALYYTITNKIEEGVKIEYISSWSIIGMYMRIRLFLSTLSFLENVKQFNVRNILSVIVIVVMSYSIIQKERLLIQQDKLINLQDILNKQLYKENALLHKQSLDVHNSNIKLLKIIKETLIYVKEESK